ncbi:hypothetical protein IMG5_170090 [Ichthyophthirius multifiliis]|uniref:Uncharacterized protein n=1 Tax=Ichthyophthirius multifiliis TaxID=5932 RepID=G0R1F2_ICHMU|nr:hypothetical protein IMG5_170090 [Ichthyophthirius multifiliis]EGR28709.1 hypothetical protein IMG5_170090 [Ichthyophthirius multifiliis]|eukprot:XP_004029945.1 hypothetical protein IMG5_170090 [Ichthyophthirius multifiliis]
MEQLLGICNYQYMYQVVMTRIFYKKTYKMILIRIETQNLNNFKKINFLAIQIKNQQNILKKKHHFILIMRYIQKWKTLKKIMNQIAFSIQQEFLKMEIKMKKNQKIIAYYIKFQT